MFLSCVSLADSTGVVSCSQQAPISVPSSAYPSLWGVLWAGSGCSTFVLVADGCMSCLQLASIQHLLSMSEAGTRGCFVNPYGYADQPCSVLATV